MIEDDGFYIETRGNRLLFRGQGRIWSPVLQKEYRNPKIMMARFLFDELQGSGAFYDSTNFLLTTKARRGKVERRLKSIVENNEW